MFECCDPVLPLNCKLMRVLIAVVLDMESLSQAIPYFTAVQLVARGFQVGS